MKNNFDPNLIPVALEQPFNIKVGDIRVGGKIDRVDKVGDMLNIIDYKTGSRIPSQREVDNNLQLSIYALAASTINTPPFGATPNKIKLSLMYFEESITISTIRTPEDLKAAEAEILDIKKQIEESDFQCSQGFLCENCEYAAFCREQN